MHAAIPVLQYHHQGTPEQITGFDRLNWSDSFVASTFKFRLPGPGIDVSPVLRVNGEIASREYILLFSLPDDPGTTLDDPSLMWSGSLQSRYRYAPESGSAGVLRTPSLSVPRASASLMIHVHRWTSDTPSAIDEIVLTADLDGRPAIIFAEGE